MPQPTFSLRRRTPPLILLGLLIALVSCSPSDEQPGLWLSGERVSTPVDDWSFVDGAEEIFIETRPWYGLPHSTTIWAVSLDGQLYVGSYGSEKKAWENALEYDPRARVLVEGRLYKVRIRPVTEVATSQALDARYRDKYDMEEVFGEDVPDWWYYRVDQTPEA